MAVTPGPSAPLAQGLPAANVLAAPAQRPTEPFRQKHVDLRGHLERIERQVLDLEGASPGQQLRTAKAELLVAE